MLGSSLIYKVYSLIVGGLARRATARSATCQKDWEREVREMCAREEGSYVFHLARYAFDTTCIAHGHIHSENHACAMSIGEEKGFV